MTDALHVLFIKRGFRCGIQTYVDKGGFPHVYADEHENFDKCSHIIVHSAPHMAHGPKWCKEQYMKVINFKGTIDLIVHERTYDIFVNMLGYKRILRKAKKIYMHSFEGYLCDYAYEQNPKAKFEPLILPYEFSHKTYEKTKEAIFLGRDSETKPVLPAKQYCYKNNLKLDVVSDYDNEEVLDILGPYKYAILPMRVEGSFSLEYTALEALDAGCHLILDTSWSATEAVVPHIENITFMNKRVKK